MHVNKDELDHFEEKFATDLSIRIQWIRNYLAFWILIL
jgi:hypothetical protein